MAEARKARRPMRRGHLRQRGNSWVVTWRIDGKQVWKSYKTREEAELYLADVQADLARGEAVAPKRAPFGEVAEAWHVHGVKVKGWKPSTARDYRSVLDAHLLPAFGERRLEDVTAATITAWRRRKMEATESPMPRRTADKVVSVLHGIFEFARAPYGVRMNPVASVERS